MKRSLALPTLALAVFASGTLACATRGPRPDQADDRYTVLQGTLHAPPILEAGDQRLLLVMQVEGKDQPMVCATENEEEPRILKALAQHLGDSEEPILLYGRDLEGAWREYQSGVDFYFEAVGYHRPDADRYFIVLTEYGDRFGDVFSGLSWARFLSSVARSAARTAF